MKEHQKASCLSVFWGVSALLASGIGVFGWTALWSFLEIPTMSPPFADMRSVQGALSSLSLGFDPQVQNPGDPWGRVLNYPMLWVRIADLLDLRDEGHYLLFESGWVLALLSCFASLLYRFPSVWILAAIFSGSTLLLIERGNNDLIMFCLIYLAVLLPFAWSAAAVIFTATVLKIYPLFSLPFLMRNKAATAVLGVCAAVFLYLNLPELIKIKGVMSPQAELSYGSLYIQSILDLRWHLAFSQISIILWHLPFILVLLFQSGSLKVTAKDERARLLFLAGGGIYMATFLLWDNWDYRLVFLVMCIPYFLSMTNALMRVLAPITVLLASNFSVLVHYQQVNGVIINAAAKSSLFVLIASLIIREYFQYIGPTLKGWRLLRPLSPGNEA